MHQQMIVLQSQRTKEFYTFATTSLTGRALSETCYDTMTGCDATIRAAIRLSG